jgi:hypothetical protein
MRAWSAAPIVALAHAGLRLRTWPTVVAKPHRIVRTARHASPSASQSIQLNDLANHPG